MTTAKAVQWDKARKLCCLRRTDDLCLVINKKTNMGNFTYKEQYGVIVICQSEEDQQATYDWLRKNGLNVKVVTV